MGLSHKNLAIIIIFNFILKVNINKIFKVIKLKDNPPDIKYQGD